MKRDSIEMTHHLFVCSVFVYDVFQQEVKEEHETQKERRNQKRCINELCDLSI